MTHELSRTLTAAKGTGVLLNIVMGAGLLTLPGLAVRESGVNSFFSWVLCALASIPLVAVFTVLGCYYPDAGGVAAYANRAFGRVGRQVAAFLLLSAVALGLPSVALTGGYYLAAIFPVSPVIFAYLLLALAVLPHLTGADQVPRILGLMASGVFVIIFVFLVFGFFYAPDQSAPLSVSEFDISKVIAPFSLLFFAFTGWEIGAGIGEEFTNPKRDFPLAMMFSFIIATLLYLGAAYVALLYDLKGFYEAPFIRFVGPVFGASGQDFISLVAALIALANLSGALWGISRLVFSLARDGMLPRRLSCTKGGVPVNSVLVTAGLLFAVLTINGLGLVNLDHMIGLAGENFLVLYGIAAASLWLITGDRGFKVLAAVVIAMVAGLLVLQGLKLLYPLAVAGLTLLYRRCDSRIVRVQ